MKTAAGTSRSETSLVWFTIGRGVLNEVFYPRIDSPCIRDACFVVTATDGFFSDERQDTTSSAPSDEGPMLKGGPIPR